MVNLGVVVFLDPSLLLPEGFPAHPHRVRDAGTPILYHDQPVWLDEPTGVQMVCPCLGSSAVAVEHSVNVQ
jgi:hypothetical protein